MWIGQSDSFADPAVDTLITHTNVEKAYNVHCLAGFNYFSDG